jgi:hypothetical protein
MDKIYDAITNWQNTHGNSYNSRFIAACAKCEGYKTKGFDASEIAELLMADGMGQAGVNEVLAKVFGPAQNTPFEKKSMELYIVPTKYADVQPLVENRLMSKGPQKFVSYLTESPEPLVVTTAKHKKSLLKLANDAYENISLMAYLHNEISPYIEEAMLDSVLLAEQHEGKIDKIAQAQYNVKLGGKQATVDLEIGKSSGNRFANGNFDKFGLADEFIVKVHDAVSPYARLKKILLQKDK